MDGRVHRALAPKAEWRRLESDQQAGAGQAVRGLRNRQRPTQQPVHRRACKEITPLMNLTPPPPIFPLTEVHRCSVQWRTRKTAKWRESYLVIPPAV